MNTLTYKAIINWFEKYKINISKEDFDFSRKNKEALMNKDIHQAQITIKPLNLEKLKPDGASTVINNSFDFATNAKESQQNNEQKNLISHTSDLKWLL